MVEVLQRLVEGIPQTLTIFAGSLAVGLIGGVPLAFARRSTILPVRLAARILVDLLRGVPPVVWLFLIYFSLAIGTFQLDEVSSAVAALGIVSSAYLAEIYRGALSAVHSGQWEASEALGLSRTTAMVRVIGPQALRVAIPSAAAYAIALIKDTSIASTIGVAEIVFVARREVRDNGGGLETFLYAGILYVGLSVLLGWVARRTERVLAARVART